MALVNQAKREINAKIVFYGPGLSGKSTNIKHVFNKLKPEFRGALKAMKVQDARMLFFDFTPPGDSSIDGHKVRFHLYTVSGDVVDQAAWKMVLKGADGIVFVADSSASRTEENREGLENLAGYLKAQGESFSSLPLVFQYNKSDLGDAVPAAELDRLLNPSRLPSFVASSHSGEGVLQTTLGLVKTVLAVLREKGVAGLSGADGVQGMVQPSAPPSVAAAPAAQAEEAPPAAVTAQGTPAAPGAPTVSEAMESEWPPGAPSPVSWSQSASVGTEWPPPYGPAAGQEEEAEESLSLVIEGSPEAVEPGRFRLPLTIRSGARSKKVVLNLALSLEEVPGRGA